MKHRIWIITFVLMLLAGCSFPVLTPPPPTGTPAPITSTDTAPPPLPTAELGLAENPLILALAPGSDTQAQIDAGKVLAEQFTQRTGYTVVTVIPDSYTALVEALERGNAHIVVLDPIAYELAYQKGLVNAAYAVTKEEKTFYGAQFIASRESGFKSHFDELSQSNVGEMAEALAQFADKKPCWSDEASPSGYVIPLGFLNRNQVVTRPAAFVQGHPTVVRSVYAGGICDFGATYIDARKFPSLEDQFPDLMERVQVIWRIPEIIPYSNLAFSTTMPPAMRDLFSGFVPAILQTDDGKAAFKTAYDIEEITPVNDTYYAEFREYVGDSQVELSSLVK